tara:strand:+ start:422 stop:760 length:339 start_codon:yes stop_codon:yes gene_type:complete
MEDLKNAVMNLSCKTNENNAPINQSRRINGNSCSILCPRWDGLDLYGRPVCLNSVRRESAGCQDPLNAVSRENMTQRPNFMRAPLGESTYSESYETRRAAQMNNSNAIRRNC